MERETENARKAKPTPPGIERKAINEARPEPGRESKPPVQIETAPSAADRKQAAPPTGKPVEKKLMSPREKSRAEQAEGNMKKGGGKNSKKGDEQEEASPATNSTRQPR
jgi:hypothetical protein